MALFVNLLSHDANFLSKDFDYATQSSQLLLCFLFSTMNFIQGKT